MESKKAPKESSLENMFLSDLIYKLEYDIYIKYHRREINDKDYSNIKSKLFLYNDLRIKIFGYRKQIIKILKDNELILHKYSINPDCIEKTADIIYKNKENPDGYNYCSYHNDRCDCKKHINKIIDRMPKEGIYNDYIDLINENIKCGIKFIKYRVKIADMLKKVDETD